MRVGSQDLETPPSNRSKERIGMLLENKKAIIYGAGGSIG